MKTKLLLSCLSTVLFGSCCTKVDCVSIDYSSQIQFHNFAGGTADSMRIEVFPAGAPLSNRIDSFNLASFVLDDSNRVAYLPAAINTDYQYRVSLVPAGPTYLINHFTTVERNCNKCFPFRPASDKYTQLSGYQVNGISYNTNQLIIRP